MASTATIFAGEPWPLTTVMLEVSMPRRSASRTTTAALPIRPHLSPPVLGSRRDERGVVKNSVVGRSRRGASDLYALEMGFVEVG